MSIWIALVVAAAAASPETQRPNIVFIMSDDHAAQAIGAYGGRLAELDPTPNIDRLAREGIRFENAFATNSICTPSRATLLTGQYSHRNGVPVFNSIDPTRPVFPQRLQMAGYYTALVGKWHLGSNPTGFDDWEILPGQGDYWNPAFYTATEDRKYQGYTTDVITDLAIAQLEKRPANQPFFLMVHHKAPHRNWQPPPRWQAKYEKLKIPEPENLFDDYRSRGDALREQAQSVARDLNRNDLKQDPPGDLAGEALVRWKYQRYLRDYLACVQGVDDSVGRLVEWLAQHQLQDNTIVIYTSDQGFFLGEHGLYDKRFMYEESLRMPLIVRWPGKIKPGTTCAALVTNCDFAPTFLDLAGLPADPQMQGSSIEPLLLGQQPADWRNAFYYRYYHDPGHHKTHAHCGIRTTTHKLIHFWRKNQWECYDLLRDPQEMHNLAEDLAAAELVAKLRSQLVQLKAEVGDEDQFADEQPPDDVDVRRQPNK